MSNKAPRDFVISDVFAEGPYAGNQLATMFDARDLADDEMQKIAREFNFPETSFVVGGDVKNGFDVRIFTPVEELPFAGHPTLGTAFALRARYLDAGIKTLTLNLGVGPIPVTFGDDGVLWMRQQQPTFSATLSHVEAAEDLGLAPGQLDARFMPQWVSTGVEFLIVAVNTLSDLKACESVRRPRARATLVFCPQGYTEAQALGARMFAEELGVVEDPATGSANGCLAAYLLKNNYFGASDDNDLTLEIAVGQGYEILRPSQLYLRASRQANQYTINVGGRVNAVASGQWLV